jgi:aflatoxin B1 aldehyde reductase
MSVDMLEEWLQIAEEEGYVKPTVYQGQYNLLCRTYEATLFPLLRKHDISFVAFSPLAGDFLTGKLTLSNGPEDLQGTRFQVSDTNFGGMRYRGFYDKAAMHEALQKAAPVCTAHGVGLFEAALRWLLYHSCLDSDRGDCIIIGSSRISQIDSYVKARSAGPLQEELAKDLDALCDNQVEEAAGPIVTY